MVLPLQPKADIKADVIQGKTILPIAAPIQAMLSARGLHFSKYTLMTTTAEV